MCLQENNGVGSDTLISLHAVWQFVLMRKKSCRQTIFRACRWEGDVDRCWLVNEWDPYPVPVSLPAPRWTSASLPSPSKQAWDSLMATCQCFSLFKLRVWFSLISPVNQVKGKVERFSQRVAQSSSRLVLQVSSVFQLMITSWNHIPLSAFVGAICLSLAASVPFTLCQDENYILYIFHKLITFKIYIFLYQFKLQFCISGFEAHSRQGFIALCDTRKC